MNDILLMAARFGPDGGWHGPAGAVWWLGPFVFALVVLALIAGILVLALNRSRRSGASATDSARRILAERFARGEIEHEEYQGRLSQL